MFRWITEALENARIARDFRQSEEVTRELHLAAADRRFPTKHLEREIAGLARAPAREAALRFGPPAAALRAEIAGDRERARELRQKLSVLERNYKGELDELHRKVRAASEELDDLNEEKNLAHKDFEKAKSSIDHWYRMSNCYLGNRGKEIPKSRMFGRSQNDLEYYKSKKSDAAKRLGVLREEIEELKDDKLRYRQAIEATKASRQEMFDLRKSGATASALKQEISEHEAMQSEREARLRRIEGERAAFVAQARHSLGIPERQQEVERIKAARQAFRESFDSSASVARRREQHGREWRARHPRGRPPG